MPANTVPSPAQLWTQALQTWTEAWTATTPAARTQANGAPPTDPFALWQRAYDQWMSGWTALLESTFQTPEAVAASGRILDASLNIEKPLRERTSATMQFWLEFFNLPSRGDLIRVATQLNDANARLDELQTQVEDLSDQVAALRKATAQTVK